MLIIVVQRYRQIGTVFRNSQRQKHPKKELRIQDTGYRIQHTGYRIQDTGYSMPPRPEECEINPFLWVDDQKQGQQKENEEESKEKDEKEQILDAIGSKYEMCWRVDNAIYSLG